MKNLLRTLLLVLGIMFNFLSLGIERNFTIGEMLNTYLSSWGETYPTIQKINNQEDFTFYLQKHDYNRDMICERDIYVGMFHGGKKLTNNSIFSLDDNFHRMKYLSTNAITIFDCLNNTGGFLVERYKEGESFPADYVRNYDQGGDLNDYEEDKLKKLPYKLLLPSPQYCEIIQIDGDYKLRFNFINFEKVKSDMKQKEEVVSAALVDVGVYEEYCSQSSSD